MATGLRDEIKTMRGRRQEAGQGAQRSPLIDGSLSPVGEARQEWEAGAEREREDGGGRGGERPSSFRAS